MYTTTLTPRQEAKQKGLTRYISEPCIYGHVSERFVRNNSCVLCHKLASKVSKKKARVRKQANRPAKLLHMPKTEFEKWIDRSKAGRNKKLRTALSREYYKTLYVTHCPLLKIELTYGPYIGAIPKNYASLDKIDPEKEYVEGNVQIISFRANTLKNSATLSEMQMIVNNWKNATHR